MINVTNYSKSDWYFDYITSESLANLILNGEVLQAGNAELIDASNYSMLTFESGWSDGIDGTFSSLYGGKASNVSDVAAYQVNDQDPVTIPLPAVLPSVTSSANQLLFTADNLNVGEHTVPVIFNGTQSGMPLEIGVFLRKITHTRATSIACFAFFGPSFNYTLRVNPFWIEFWSYSWCRFWLYLSDHASHYDRIAEETKESATC
ncbi:hypothetical protein J3R30DRAFT_3404468 [Lentinula aciculospora]|uniref:Uncharacterized protein n=1 Tax=Lentinula aciculospora TaxID=153920 RepID=A0A9W9AAQ2_9AGAR|nr:hypothetical protein J3R30DRAFT_3404468 [Lentinula aciculospora]